MAYQKDPNEKKDYTVDWSRHLTGADTISTSTWAVPAGLTSGSPASTKTNTTATVWIAGGTTGTTYRVTNQVLTAQGRIFERSFEINVTDL